jgi:hypothetical protein
MKIDPWQNTNKPMNDKYKNDEYDLDTSKLWELIKKLESNPPIPEVKRAVQKTAEQKAKEKQKRFEQKIIREHRDEVLDVLKERYPEEFI